MPGQLNFMRIDVDGYDMVASVGKLDSIPADATKSVHNNIRLAAVGDVFGDFLRRDRVPRFVI